METRGFIRRRGFWLLALLWLPAGVMATAAVRFGPGTGSVPPGMWVMAMLMSGGGLVFVAPCGLPLALGCRRLWHSGLPPRRLVGGHRARCCHGGGVAVGGAARAAGDRDLCGRDQPAGVDRLVVVGAPELITDDGCRLAVTTDLPERGFTRNWK